MDTNNPLILKLNKAVPGAALESRRFGRSDITSIWVEVLSIQKVALVLKSDADLKLDWLENLSIMEFEGVLIASYFLRSTFLKHEFIIRASVVPLFPEAEVSFPSIRSVWPMGEPMENEAQEMFGVRFVDSQSEEERWQSTCLPEGWKGFPLRKAYVFPKEVFGMPHSRNFNRSNQKKT